MLTKNQVWRTTIKRSHAQWPLSSAGGFDAAKLARSRTADIGINSSPPSKFTVGNRVDSGDNRQ
ncbi:hypothetical protein [Paenibacillus sp. A14]|uniref:hypothetical protein n=1 Tax=Paenibacillus sp. A14 TaxID=3119820 RepID=UPI002FE0E44E